MIHWLFRDQTQHALGLVLLIINMLIYRKRWGHSICWCNALVENQKPLKWPNGNYGTAEKKSEIKIHKMSLAETWTQLETGMMVLKLDEGNYLNQSNRERVVERHTIVTGCLWREYRKAGYLWSMLPTCILALCKHSFPAVQWAKQSMAWKNTFYGRYKSHHSKYHSH